MSAINSWSPHGCGAGGAGMAGKAAPAGPSFPRDFISRVEPLDLGIENVFLAWEVARLAGDKSDPGQQRALVLLILAARVLTGEGSTRLPLVPDSQLDRILDEFKTAAAEKETVVRLADEARKICMEPADSGLSAIFGGPGSYRPLIIDHGCLYFQKLHVLEARVGSTLHNLICSPAASRDPNTESALAEVIAAPPAGPAGRIELDTGQIAAVRAALEGRITVINGRPGSGKTSIVAGILRVLARTGNPPLESVALAAPTGKAADRMLRSIADHLLAVPEAGDADRRLAGACPPSSTLHRLLGYSPGLDRFRHNENNPLAEHLIIIDESSMIDLAMMDHLLRALRPEARVIFLGDADQLPPVETGAVLRDLCRSPLAKNRGRVAVLEKSYRAREEDSGGKSILAAADAINRGSFPAESDREPAVATRKQAQEILFEGIERLVPGSAEQRNEFFARWHNLLCRSLPELEELLSKVYTAGPAGFTEPDAGNLRKITAYFERFKILCATRVTAGGTGSEAVNGWFHRRWVESRGTAADAPDPFDFQIGEPVMITRNDYSLRLYNGDSGLVLRVASGTGAGLRPAAPMAVFPRGGSFVAFPPGVLRGRLERAWATTVHKAQGSEHENVVLLLPATPLRPLTRELLYTAVTRAKKSVVIIGPNDVLAAGVKRTMERASGLADILA